MFGISHVGGGVRLASAFGCFFRKQLEVGDDNVLMRHRVVGATDARGTIIRLGAWYEPHGPKKTEKEEAKATLGDNTQDCRPSISCERE